MPGEKSHSAGATQALCADLSRIIDLELPASPQEVYDSDSDDEQDVKICDRVILAKTPQYLKLLQKAKGICQDIILSKKTATFPYTKLENLFEDLKERLPHIYSSIRKDLIWTNMLNWLFAMRQSFEGLYNLKYDDKFNLILAEIIAEYVHYKCWRFAKSKSKDPGKVTNEILGQFAVFFNGNQTYALIALLRVDVNEYTYDDKYTSVLCPIFNKYLSKTYINRSTEFTYSKLILCFKKWKSLVHTTKQKEEINVIAMGNSKEKHPSGVLPSKMPETSTEVKFLSIFPMHKLARKLQEKYGRNAGARTLLRDETSDLNEMISAYFTAFIESVNQRIIDSTVDTSRRRQSQLEFKTGEHTEQQSSNSRSTPTNSLGCNNSLRCKKNSSNKATSTSSNSKGRGTPQPKLIEIISLVDEDDGDSDHQNVSSHSAPKISLSCNKNSSNTATTTYSSSKGSECITLVNDDDGDSEHQNVSSTTQFLYNERNSLSPSSFGAQSFGNVGNHCDAVADSGIVNDIQTGSPEFRPNSSFSNVSSYEDIPGHVDGISSTSDNYQNDYTKHPKFVFPYPYSICSRCNNATNGIYAADILENPQASKSSLQHNTNLGNGNCTIDKPNENSNQFVTVRKDLSSNLPLQEGSGGFENIAAETTLTGRNFSMMSAALTNSLNARQFPFPAQITDPTIEQNFTESRHISQQTRPEYVQKAFSTQAPSKQSPCVPFKQIIMRRVSEQTREDATLSRLPRTGEDLTENNTTYLSVLNKQNNLNITTDVVGDLARNKGETEPGSIVTNSKPQGDTEKSQMEAAANMIKERSVTDVCPKPIDDNKASLAKVSVSKDIPTVNERHEDFNTMSKHGIVTPVKNVENLGKEVIEDNIKISNNVKAIQILDECLKSLKSLKICGTDNKTKAERIDGSNETKKSADQKVLNIRSLSEMAGDAHKPVKQSRQDATFSPLLKTGEDLTEDNTMYLSALNKQNNLNITTDVGDLARNKEETEPGSIVKNSIAQGDSEKSQTEASANMIKERSVTDVCPKPINDNKTSLAKVSLSKDIPTVNKRNKDLNTMSNHGMVTNVKNVENLGKEVIEDNTKISNIVKAIQTCRSDTDNQNKTERIDGSNETKKSADQKVLNTRRLSEMARNKGETEPGSIVKNSIAQGDSEKSQTEAAANMIKERSVTDVCPKPINYNKTSLAKVSLSKDIPTVSKRNKDLNTMSNHGIVTNVKNVENLGKEVIEDNTKIFNIVKAIQTCRSDTHNQNKTERIDGSNETKKSADQKLLNTRRLSEMAGSAYKPVKQSREDAPFSRLLNTGEALTEEYTKYLSTLYDQTNLNTYDLESNNIPIDAAVETEPGPIVTNSIVQENSEKSQTEAAANMIKDRSVNDVCPKPIDDNKTALAKVSVSKDNPSLKHNKENKGKALEKIIGVIKKNKYDRNNREKDLNTMSNYAAVTPLKNIEGLGKEVISKSVSSVKTFETGNDTEGERIDASNKINKLADQRVLQQSGGEKITKTSPQKCEIEILNSSTKQAPESSTNDKIIASKSRNENSTCKHTIYTLPVSINLRNIYTTELWMKQIGLCKNQVKPDVSEVTTPSDNLNSMSSNTHVKPENNSISQIGKPSEPLDNSNSVSFNVPGDQDLSLNGLENPSEVKPSDQPKSLSSTTNSVSSDMSGELDTNYLNLLESTSAGLTPSDQPKSLSPTTNSVSPDVSGEHDMSYLNLSELPRAVITPSDKTKSLSSTTNSESSQVPSELDTTEIITPSDILKSLSSTTYSVSSDVSGELDARSLNLLENSSDTQKPLPSTTNSVTSNMPGELDISCLNLSKNPSAVITPFDRTKSMSPVEPDINFINRINKTCEITPLVHTELGNSSNILANKAGNKGRQKNKRKSKSKKKHSKRQCRGVGINLVSSDLSGEHDMNCLNLSENPTEVITPSDKAKSLSSTTNSVSSDVLGQLDASCLKLLQNPTEVVTLTDKPKSPSSTTNSVSTDVVDELDTSCLNLSENPTEVTTHSDKSKSQSSNTNSVSSDVVDELDTSCLNLSENPTEVITPSDKPKSLSSTTNSVASDVVDELDTSCLNLSENPTEVTTHSDKSKSQSSTTNSVSSDVVDELDTSCLNLSENPTEVTTHSDKSKSQSSTTNSVSSDVVGELDLLEHPSVVITPSNKTNSMSTVETDINFISRIDKNLVQTEPESSSTLLANKAGNKIKPTKKGKSPMKSKKNQSKRQCTTVGTAKIKTEKFGFKNRQNEIEAKQCMLAETPEVSIPDHKPYGTAKIETDKFGFKNPQNASEALLCMFADGSPAHQAPDDLQYPIVNQSSGSIASLITFANEPKTEDGPGTSSVTIFGPQNITCKETILERTQIPTSTVYGPGLPNKGIKNNSETIEIKTQLNIALKNEPWHQNASLEIFPIFPDNKTRLSSESEANNQGDDIAKTSELIPLTRRRSLTSHSVSDILRPKKQVGDNTRIEKILPLSSDNEPTRPSKIRKTCKSKKRKQVPPPSESNVKLMDSNPSLMEISSSTDTSLATFTADYDTGVIDQLQVGDNTRTEKILQLSSDNEFARPPKIRKTYESKKRKKDHPPNESNVKLMKSNSTLMEISSSTDTSLATFTADYDTAVTDQLQVGDNTFTEKILQLSSDNECARPPKIRKTYESKKRKQDHSPNESNVKLMKSNSTLMEISSSTDTSLITLPADYDAAVTNLSTNFDSVVFSDDALEQEERKDNVDSKDIEVKDTENEEDRGSLSEPEKVGEIDINLKEKDSFGQQNTSCAVELVTSRGVSSDAKNVRDSEEQDFFNEQVLIKEQILDGELLVDDALEQEENKDDVNSKDIAVNDAEPEKVGEIDIKLKEKDMVGQQNTSSAVELVSRGVSLDAINVRNSEEQDFFNENVLIKEQILDGELLEDVKSNVQTLKLGNVKPIELAAVKEEWIEPLKPIDNDDDLSKFYPLSPISTTPLTEVTASGNSEIPIASTSEILSTKLIGQRTDGSIIPIPMNVVQQEGSWRMLENIFDDGVTTALEEDTHTCFVSVKRINDQNEILEKNKATNNQSPNKKPIVLDSGVQNTSTDSYTLEQLPNQDLLIPDAGLANSDLVDKEIIEPVDAQYTEGFNSILNFLDSDYELLTNNGNYTEKNCMISGPPCLQGTEQHLEAEAFGLDMDGLERATIIAYDLHSASIDVQWGADHEDETDHPNNTQSEIIPKSVNKDTEITSNNVVDGHSNSLVQTTPNKLDKTNHTAGKNSTQNDNQEVVSGDATKITDIFIEDHSKPLVNKSDQMNDKSDGVNDKSDEMNRAVDDKNFVDEHNPTHGDETNHTQRTTKRGIFYIQTHPRSHTGADTVNSSRNTPLNSQSRSSKISLNPKASWITRRVPIQGSSTTKENNPVIINNAVGKAGSKHDSQSQNIFQNEEGSSPLSHLPTISTYQQYAETNISETIKVVSTPANHESILSSDNVYKKNKNIRDNELRDNKSPPFQADHKNCQSRVNGLYIT